MVVRDDYQARAGLDYRLHFGKQQNQGKAGSIFVQHGFLSCPSVDLAVSMSLHWNIVAGFLYSELAFTVFLLIPFISNRVWSWVSQVPMIRQYRAQCFLLSPYDLCRKLEGFLRYYFYFVVVVMLLAFLDSFREMQKFADRDSAGLEVQD